MTLKVRFFLALECFDRFGVFDLYAYSYLSEWDGFLLAALMV